MKGFIKRKKDSKQMFSHRERGTVEATSEDLIRALGIYPPHLWSAALNFTLARLAECSALAAEIAEEEKTKAALENPTPPSKKHKEKPRRA